MKGDASSSVISIFATTIRNRTLLSLELAFAAFNGAEWAVWVALLVYAYSVGGATAAGAMALVQLIPCIFLAPYIGALADSHRPGRVLLVGYLIQGVAMSAVAAAIAVDAPAWVVFAMAPAINLGITVPRPAQSALLPSIVRKPIELTAANVVSSWAENGSVLIAPAIAGVLLGVGGPELAIVFLAALSFAAAALVLPIPGPSPIGSARDDDEGPGAAGAGGSGAGRSNDEWAVEDWVEGSVPAGGGGADAGGEAGRRVSLTAQVAAGIRAVRAEPSVRLLVLLLGSQYILVGALDVLYVVLSISVLGMGEAGAGYLNSAFGAGGLIGAALTAGLVARRRLAPALGAGVLTAALALGLLGIFPTVLTAFALLALAGLGRTVLDVTGRILLQRSAPPHVLADVFSMLESLMNVGLAFGSVIVPILVGLSGARAALIGTGVIFLLIMAASWRRLSSVDAAATVPHVEIRLLQSIPIFAPLPAPALEGLARALTPESAPAGAVMMREGEVGEHYCAIASGEVAVTHGGKEVARLSRGEGFGEIALIEDVPRTATVTATQPTDVYCLEKEPFVLALTGHATAKRAASSVVTKRLDELGRAALEAGAPSD
ncbi:MAG: MFS transporter [Thermoleophilia bacterium]|nr:MFS transporter [Thermoleophilia bacterium]